MAMLLLQAALRAALVATATACIMWALRVRAAALRHAAWTIVVLVMLLLPIVSVAGANIRLAVLPGNEAALDSGLPGRHDPGNAASGASVVRPGPVAVANAAPSIDGFARAMFLIAGVYLLGALALLIRLAIGTAQANRLRRRAVIRAGRATSTRCATPVTIGWLSPVLILPEGWEQWPAAQLDAVLTHEHEHARRHDPLVQWLALLNRAIFWFHPLAWWLERKLANLAEEVCDAAVIRAGHSPQDYSGYLIGMARVLAHQGGRLTVVGMAMPGSNLGRRLRNIFEESPMTRLTRTRAICTLALCTASSIVCAAGVLAPRPSAGRDARTTAGTGGNVVLLQARPVASPQTSEGGAAVLRQDTPVSDSTTHPEAASPTPPVVQPIAEPQTDSPVPVQDEQPQMGKPDFSGHWTLVSATYAGRGRGGTGEAGVERNVTVKWNSGAPINCGPQCTITQDATALTVSRLGTTDAVTVYDNGVVALNLDGTDSKVTQQSGTQYVVHARWDGDKVIVTYEQAHYTVTQILSIQDGRLKIVTAFSVGDAPVTMTYAKG